MALRALVLGSLVSAAGAVELTADTWDEMTAGKTVFVKFQAPWCGHCKSMKPAWDKLMSVFEGTDGVLVADVDCTAGGKSLCDTKDVQGFPTIKHGDPNDLEDYEGGRDFDSLKKFADENLGPKCSPTNIDLCDEAKKKEIESFQAMGKEALITAIKEKEALIEDENSKFEKAVKELQATYEGLTKTKEEAIDKIKASGLSRVKSVAAYKKAQEDKGEDGEDDEEDEDAGDQDEDEDDDQKEGDDEEGEDDKDGGDEDEDEDGEGNDEDEDGEENDEDGGEAEDEDEK